MYNYTVAYHTMKTTQQRKEMDSHIVVLWKLAESTLNYTCMHWVIPLPHLTGADVHQKNERVTELCALAPN